MGSKLEYSLGKSTIDKVGPLVSFKPVCWLAVPTLPCASVWFASTINVSVPSSIALTSNVAFHDPKVHDTSWLAGVAPVIKTVTLPSPLEHVPLTGYKD